ncbi:MAG: S49 family peptidase [Proteobacteria bacterium]|nr:S49 family peptidase [Pseudomonadota bacterium]
MTSYAHIVGKLTNRPLALHPRKAELVLGGVGERLGFANLVRLDGAVVPLQAFDLDPWDEDDGFRRQRETRVDPGYDMVADTGVAVISIEGTLVHKLRSLRPYSGMVGYDGIRQAYFTALEDPAVKAIATVYDTGGGDISGLFDLADAMYDARGIKPVWAILDDCAYSAGCVLSTTADRVIVPRSGGTGSAGVIAMHIDASRALDKAGLDVTMITSEDADRKTDGHSEVPFTAEARAAIQAEVNEAGELLYATVARNRGLTAEAVKGLKAATFQGANGVAAGLADAVMAPDEAFRALLAELA